MNTCYESGGGDYSPIEKEEDIQGRFTEVLAFKD